MTLRRSSLIVAFALASLASGVWASSQRETTCYRLNEQSLQLVDESPYVLCLTSSDLNQYPKSVVTVTFFKEEPGATQAKILARRHYTQVREGEFGSRKSGSKRAMVVFRPTERVVTLGFLAKNWPKSFFYKEIRRVIGQAAERLGRQKLELGRLDTR